ncbi:hypothetical protein Vadar_030059 [Vaccinium darrowii]|uniref:Uncharacterized protein n=1 Tax=Vaccinium darrowii TaxID=229202 RepID=A0ACB7ZGA7_9ERIC|nr:hypothetical protein Vadar_030059 [Vaccinium darrowii]
MIGDDCLQDHLVEPSGLIDCSVHYTMQQLRIISTASLRWVGSRGLRRQQIQIDSVFSDQKEPENVDVVVAGGYRQRGELEDSGDGALSQANPRD